MKNILLYIITSLALLALVACGGGGGSGGAGGGGVSTPTTAILNVDLAGTLPAATAISGTDFTLTLPANVTPLLSNGAVAAAVVTYSGTFANSTLAPLVTYTAATLATPGTLRVILTTSTIGGVNQLGEVATIILQLANGAAPTAGSFGQLSAVSVIDATIGATINGMGAAIANLTLQ